MDRKQQIEETVKFMSDFVNSFGSDEKEFARLMGCEHRTLQQNFTRLCVAWFEYLSRVKDNWYDLRNEGSVELGRKFVEKLKDDLYLPHI